MRHRTRSRRLGVKTGHRLAMLRNLTKGLVENGRIKTTTPRAKALRPFVEKIVTILKDPTLSNLRLAHKNLGNRTTVSAIAKTISPAFKTRPGGYTRILKLAAPRRGDAADMALIEWVDESLVKAYQKPEKTEKAAKGSKTKKAADAANEGADEGAEAAETSKAKKKSAPAKKKKTK